MSERPVAAFLTRRDLLKLGAAAVARPRAEPQTPKRGGVFRIAAQLEPVAWDPHQTISFATMTLLSFAHSRLMIIYDIQRLIAEKAYYLYDASQKVVSAWEPYVKNWGPNNGFDYGGRMMAAWLDR